MQAIGFRGAVNSTSVALLEELVDALRREVNTGRSISSIARAADVNTTTLTRLLAGERQTLTVKVAEAVARELGLRIQLGRELKKPGRKRGR